LAIVPFDPNVLANYYFARLPLTRAATKAAAPGVLTPWDIRNKPPAQEAADVSARSSDPYFDPKDRRLFADANGSTASAGSQIEALVAKTLSKPGADGALGEDNHKLFALYQALHRLDHIAQMANREGSVDGQRPGLNVHFQDGLKQILSYVDDASLKNVVLMAGTKSASTESSVVIPYAAYNYTGKGVVEHSGWNAAMTGVTAADSFTIAITKGGVTTNVDIDLANVSGTLSMDNINSYVNQQLQDAGFSTRFVRVQTGGSIVEDTATWGIRINNSGSETVTLSSAAAETTLYIAGTSGAPAGQQGRLTKLGNLSGTPESVFSASIAPESGAASAKATAVDSEGNVYVVGNASGSLGNQINQGTQDVFLTKYDSAGQVLWQRLLGSAQTTSAYALKVDPTGGVVVAGSVTGDLTPTAIGGSTDSFVAKYDSHGNQSWLRQTAPVAADQAMSLAVDASGNVYVGGQLSGAISGSHTSAGGTDAYVTKLSNKGVLVYHRQFGTAGTDSASQTAIAADGNLIVASVQNGRAIVSKYAAADGTSAAMWSVDLGDLQNGGISGLVVSDDQVYLSGTTANAALDAGGAANIAQASNGGSEAFIFNLTDSGASAVADFISYVGTTGSEQGGGLALAGGKLYLTGTTNDTFAGQTRTVAGTHNMFVTQLTSSGVSEWTTQYGGRDGQSKGLAIAADASGASVLDALGLPRGKIDITQSSIIESQTTARPGDYFMLKITDHTGEREVKISLAKGDTLRSLATRINGHLLLGGKATALPTAGGQTLKIAVNEGTQVELIAGEKDFDALAGLGLEDQVLIKEATTDAAAKSSAVTIGLALTGKLDLLTKTDASHAHAVLLAAMAQIKQAYAKLNDPPPAAAIGPGPAYLQSQLGSYQTALTGLSMFGSSRNV
jgi:hypothetical protein